MHKDWWKRTAYLISWQSERGNDKSQFQILLHSIHYIPKQQTLLQYFAHVNIIQELWYIRTFFKTTLPCLYRVQENPLNKSRGQPAAYAYSLFNIFIIDVRDPTQTRMNELTESCNLKTLEDKMFGSPRVISSLPRINARIIHPFWSNQSIMNLNGISLLYRSTAVIETVIIFSFSCFISKKYLWKYIFRRVYILANVLICRDWCFIDNFLDFLVPCLACPKKNAWFFILLLRHSFPWKLFSQLSPVLTRRYENYVS